MSDNGHASPDVLDLDSIRPAKRTVRLNGKDIDVSRVPFEVFLDIAGNLDRLQALGAVGTDGKLQMPEGEAPDFRGALELLHGAAIKVMEASPDKPSREDIQSLDTFQMFDLIVFVVRPFFEKVGSSKNLLAAGLNTG